MQLTKSQKTMVEKLFNAFEKRNEYKFASCKAPTGSGKTFMASEFISWVFANQFETMQKTIFIVATISNAELPIQFAKKLEQYKKFHIFNDYKIKYIESPSNKKINKSENVPEFVLENNKIFVFGTSSFGKNTLFFQNKTLDTFLQQANEYNYQIFFIRDEAHIGKRTGISKNDLKTFDEKMKKHAKFILEITATPKNSKNLIKMTTEDMNNDDFYLLKTNMKKTKLFNDVTNDQIIDDAIKTFKKSKKEYQKITNTIINPAMLIQVMNEANYKKDPIKNEQFKQGLAVLERKLQKAGLKYLKYLNNMPQVVGTNVPNTLEYASESDSEIDAIIFKVGPATGWDIPRANMLLQIRNVSSETLNMQTLGRIMRNPYPKLKYHNTTDKYYVWSNYQNPTREEVTYKLKNKFWNENFISGIINKSSNVIMQDNKKYQKGVIDFINSNIFKNKAKEIVQKNGIIYDTLSYGLATVKNQIPNHIHLKIYNLKMQKDYENELKISWFLNELANISQSQNINLEIVKYVFLSFVDKLKKIKSKNIKWIKSNKPYEINKDSKTLRYYQLWKDNSKPKKVNTSDFENYGYHLVDDNQDIQYLDSSPELKFFEDLKTVISEKQRKNISFFAKMPTLGSQVFFEYYSQSQGKIVKSFMDFAIKYKGKIIMIEVKSDDEDYNKEKTNELLDAYKIYMENFYAEKLALILFKYNKKDNHNCLYGYINKEWEECANFRDLFDQLLD